MNKKSVNHLIAGTTAFLIGMSLPAAAAELEEVIVTSQKREQTLKDVPIAVTAFSEDMIADMRVEDVRGLVDFTPGFNGRTEDSFIDALGIRGIVTNDFGIGGDPSVAVFVDGVWAGRTGGVQMNFYDVQRAEVVKGPQATLFGRNAIAGAVSIINNKPVDEFEGHVAASAAEYGEVELSGMINVPLNDKWYWRTAGKVRDTDGYLKNQFGGRDLGFHTTSSVRSSLRYAGEATDATLTIGYEDREQDPSVYWDRELGLPVDVVNIDLAGNGKDESEIFHATANIEYDLNDDLVFSSTTGYKTYNFTYLEDYDARPTRINNYFQHNEVDYFSQEFRLNGNRDAITWFAGVSLYSEDIKGNFGNFYDEDALCAAISRTDADDFDGPAASCDDPNFETYWEADPGDLAGGAINKGELNNLDMDSSGWAAYAEATWALSDTFDLTVGARYTYDEKQAISQVFDSGGVLGNNFNFEFYTDGTVSDTRDWSKFTPRLAFSWDSSEQVTVFGNFSTGYKSGGFATFGFSPPTGQDFVDDDEDGVADPGTRPLAFEPEEVDSFEIGLKTRLLDNSLQANVSYYNYKYKDLQLSYFDLGSSLVANVGEAKGQGLEFDGRWLPNDQLDLFVTASFMDTEISEDATILDVGACALPCKGNDLPFAPRFSGAFVARYMIPVTGGEVAVTAEHVYQSKMYSDPDNIEAIAVDAWSESALRVGYESENDWRVTLWVENLFDESYFERGWANADPDNTFGYGLTNTLVWPAKPRTFGISFDRHF